VAFISPSLALLFSFPTYLSLSYISGLAWWFSKLPFAAYTIPVFSFYLVPIAYSVIGYFLWRFRKPELPLTKNSAEETWASWVIEEESEEATKKAVPVLLSDTVPKP
jgi:hypothetical protein